MNRRDRRRNMAEFRMIRDHQVEGLTDAELDEVRAVWTPDEVAAYAAVIARDVLTRFHAHEHWRNRSAPIPTVEEWELFCRRVRPRPSAAEVEAAAWSTT